ncbi:MAG: hypothetical protein Q8L86_07235 [Vicinamibacterales bacterium]|nr:hypothetical protein [Vicinamibacterales bacterium]
MLSSPAVYLAGGLRLASTLPLPPLSAAPAGAPDWTITVADELPPSCHEWFHHWDEEDGSLWLSFGRLASGYLLQFAHSASFEVRPAERTIRAYAMPGTPDDTVRHLLLNQVLPLLVAAPGRLALHASAVAGPEGIVAFVGPGGSGKSTLAAACVKRGWSLVTDDVLIVTPQTGQMMAVPSFCELRLWRDVADAVFPEAAAVPAVADYSTKRRLGPETNLRFLAHPAPLARLFLIDRAMASDDQAVTRVPVAPRDAVVALTRCAFVLDVTNRAALRTSFGQLATLVERVAVVGLVYPRALDRLDDVLAAIGVPAPSRRAAG